MPQPSPTAVAVVLVTWNRRDLLEQSLAAVRAQTAPPQRIVVVDNASTDATATFLAAEATADPHLEVITTEENLGGAGGFALGLDVALRGGADAVWLMDDDTVPTPTALAELVAARARFVADGTESAVPAVVASKVVWTDGRDHPMNTPREKPLVSAAERADARAVGCLAIRTASFVSILVDAARVREVGLPVADFFLWNDDFEFTARLLRGHRGLYCPSSVVVHKTKVFGSTDADPGERFRFEVRNKLWTLGRSPAFTLTERATYVASTGVRWARTFARSRDRATLRRALAAGLAEGLRAGPRPNSQVVPQLAAPQLAAPQSADDSARCDRYEQLPSGQPFSVLMAVWRGDKPDLLADSFESVTTGQIRPPAEVVLVQDGPVPDDLADRVATLIATSPVPVRHVVQPQNRGLGEALTAGLAQASHDIVARQDADDLSLPERFAMQIPVIEAGAAVVGAGLLEFDDDPAVVVGHRTPVTDPVRIRSEMRFHQTFYHPTVVYRASAVRAVGGYEHLDLLEDYLLFAKLVAAGVPVANLDTPLVLYRVGEGAYARRGGLRLLRSEVALQRRFREIGFTSPVQQVRNLTVRGVYRLVPEQVRRRAYRAILATRGDRTRGDRAGGADPGQV